jgi:hypothetical protein
MAMAQARPVAVVFLVVLEVDDDFDAVVVHGHGVDIVGHRVGVDRIHAVAAFDDLAEHHGILAVVLVFGLVHFIRVDQLEHAADQQLLDHGTALVGQAAIGGGVELFGAGQALRVLHRQREVLAADVQAGAALGPAPGQACPRVALQQQARGQRFDHFLRPARPGGPSLRRRRGRW